MKLKQALFEVSVKALVYDKEGRLLFAKDTNGIWDLPGGRIDTHETTEQCLRREVREELGVEIRKIHPMPKFAEVIDYNNHERRVVIGFIVDLESSEFGPSEENQEHKFLGKDEMVNFKQAYAGLNKIKDLFY